MVAWQIYDGKTVSALDKWREGANKTMRGNDAISFSLLWLEIAVLRVSKRGLAAVKSTCTAFASCAVKDDIKMWFQNSHTHTIEIVSTHYCTTFFLSTRWDLRRLETETCWFCQLRAATFCLPTSRFENSGHLRFYCNKNSWDFVQQKFFARQNCKCGYTYTCCCVSFFLCYDINIGITLGILLG